MNLVEVIVQTTSIVSACFSLTIVVTFLIFPSLQESVFRRIFFMVSICDMFACIVQAFGFPAKDSILCVVQGPVVYFFYRASWLWTTCLVYQLYAFVVKDSPGLREYQMHLLCWITSIVLEVLPLSTGTQYGIDDKLSGYAVCGLENGNNPGRTRVWFWLTFQAPLIVCIALMILFAILIRKFIKKQDVPNPRHTATASALKWYPIGMIICWLPNLLLSAIIVFSSSSNDDDGDNISNDLLMATLGFAVLYGVELTILFFIYSYEARALWKKMLFGDSGEGSDRDSSSFFYRGSSLQIHEYKEDNSGDDRNLEILKIDQSDTSTNATIMSTNTTQV